MGTIVFLALLLVVAVYAVMTYNGLVNVKHGVSKAWANIDVLLKQRHDEIPKKRVARSEVVYASQSTGSNEGSR